MPLPPPSLEFNRLSENKTYLPTKDPISPVKLDVSCSTDAIQSEIAGPISMNSVESHKGSQAASRHLHGCFGQPLQKEAGLVVCRAGESCRDLACRGQSLLELNIAGKSREPQECSLETAIAVRVSLQFETQVRNVGV